VILVRVEDNDVTLKEGSINMLEKQIELALAPA
jgi:hypothetical protein